MKFIINTSSPLSIIENPSFIELFEGKGVKISSRRRITKLLDANHDLLISNLKNNFNKISYVCTTADVWSARRRSFFGYTCHWIDENFQRQSASLACRRIAGSHTFDKIANLIQSLNSEFGLTKDKIVCTITDNGSNFVKAFKEFGVQSKLFLVK